MWYFDRTRFSESKFTSFFSICSYQQLTGNKLVLKLFPNFHCCFTYCQLTDVTRGRLYDFLQISFPIFFTHFLIHSHFMPHLCHLLCSSRGQKLCKNVRGLEHVDVSHCVALSDPAIRSISFYCRGLVILRMSGCPKVHIHTPLKPLSVPRLKQMMFPLINSCHMFSISSCSTSDDRYGSAVSDKWISVPART